MKSEYHELLRKLKGLGFMNLMMAYVEANAGDHIDIESELSIEALDMIDSLYHELNELIENNDGDSIEFMN